MAEKNGGDPNDVSKSWDDPSTSAGSCLAGWLDLGWEQHRSGAVRELCDPGATFMWILS